MTSDTLRTQDELRGTFDWTTARWRIDIADARHLMATVRDAQPRPLKHAHLQVGPVPETVWQARLRSGALDAACRVTLQGAVTQETVALALALPNVQHLRLIRPDPQANLAMVEPPTALRTLSLTACTALQSEALLAACGALRHVEVSAPQGAFERLGASLARLNLETLVLHGINIDGRQLMDALAGSRTCLEALSLNAITGLSTLDWLRGPWSTLRALSLESCNIDDNSTPLPQTLKMLSLARSRVRGLAPNKPHRLKHLDLRHVRLTRPLTQLILDAPNGWQSLAVSASKSTAMIIQSILNHADCTLERLTLASGGPSTEVSLQPPPAPRPTLQEVNVEPGWSLPTSLTQDLIAGHVAPNLSVLRIENHQHNGVSIHKVAPTLRVLALTGHVGQVTVTAKATHLRALTLERAGFGDDLGDWLAACPNIQHLELLRPLSPDLDALAHAIDAVAPQVEVLAITGVTSFNNEPSVEIGDCFRTASLTKLRELSILWTDLDDAAFALLLRPARSPDLSKLAFGPNPPRAWESLVKLNFGALTALQVDTDGVPPPPDRHPHADLHPLRFTPIDWV